MEKNDRQKTDSGTDCRHFSRVYLKIKGVNEGVSPSIATVTASTILVVLLH